jgi:outer membrane protein
LGFLFPAQYLFAGTNGANVLTLDAAIERALDENNQIQSSKFAWHKARWDRRYAWTLLLPTLSFNTRFTRIDDETFAERDFRRYLPPELAEGIPQTVFQESYFSSLDVSAPLFNGALLNGLRIARANEQAARFQNSYSRENVTYQVISGYLDVLKATEVLALQREYLELSKLNYEKAERMHAGGRYSKAEALRWKVEYQQQKSLVVSSENTLRTALTELGHLLNYPYDEEVQIAPKIPEPLEQESSHLASMSNDALLAMVQLPTQDLIKTNPALASGAANVRVSNFLYRNTYANYMPNVTLSYSHGWRENNTFGLDDYSPKTLMVNLSLPVFTSFQNLSQTRSSYYDYKRAEEDFDEQLRNTRTALTQTANGLIELKTQRELFNTQVEFNEHNYRVVEKQREDGLVSNIDFIDAKLSLQNARLSAVNAEYDFIATMVNLYHLLGKVEALVDNSWSQNE